MTNLLWKLCGLGILLVVLALPSRAQNTKGDKPAAGRETRFQKSAKKEKPAKRIRSKRTASSLRKYRPRKERKGGERAGRPVSRLRTSRPDEKPHNVFPRRGPYVHNPSKNPKRIEARRSASTPRNASRRGTRPDNKPHNVYPPRGPFVHNPSKNPKRIERRTSAPSNARPRASRPAKNVYPQSGRYVNYASGPDRKPPGRRRIKPRSASRSFMARRSINAWANFPRPRQKKERAYQGDISGRRIRTKNFETQRPPVLAQERTGRRLSATPRQRKRNVYPQSGPYVKMTPQPPGRPGAFSNRSAIAKLDRLQRDTRQDPRKKKRIRPRSASRPYLAKRSTNLWARYPRPKRKGERAYTTDLAGKPLTKKNFETQRPRVLINPTARPYRRAKDTGDRAYRDADRGYRSRSRSGRPWSGDIANRKIRRNYTGKTATEGQPVVSPEKRRTGMRDQGESYTGNIKVRRILRGGGSVSGRRWNNDGRPVTARPPGRGGWGLAGYSGFLKRRRSGVSDQGEGYAGDMRYRGKAYSDQGESYTGSIRARRPPKGGGSISGRAWNNSGRAVQARTPGKGAKGMAAYRGNIRFGKRGFTDQGETYTGNIRARRPLKGGGSVSFRHWNNDGSPVPARRPGPGSSGIGQYRGNIRYGGKDLRDQGEEYTGNIKVRKPLKGGGSISFRHWNNNGRPVPARTPGAASRAIGRYQGNIRYAGKNLSNQGEEYTGDIKARGPLKGGGSVSFRHWNNKGRPVPARTPGIGSKGIGQYQGNIRFAGKDLRDQGEEYTGDIKARRPLKGGGSVSGKIWNNKNRPLAVKSPGNDQGVESIGKVRGRKRFVKNPNAADASLRVSKPSDETFAIGDVKMRSREKYVRNPNTSGEALKKRKPSAQVYAVNDLQVRVRRVPHTGKKGPEGALPGVRPSKSSARASDYSGSFRLTGDYTRNPSSFRQALRVREPGKAFARAVDYQGNIRLRKFELFEKAHLHPDARFVRANRNNVSGEKDLVTNFRLWWARLFRRNETQPAHLKEKDHKPRYDKGEAGLWYD